MSKQKKQGKPNPKILNDKMYRIPFKKKEIFIFTLLLITGFQKSKNQFILLTMV